MIKQICNLSKMQLKNLYGVNVFFHTKDKTEKKKKLALGIAYLWLIVMAIAYVGGLTYGYCYLGLSDMVPAYLIMISSVIILFFSIFKAGSVIFQRNAYDILASLPIRQSAIVVSRFLRMYVENLILTMIVMIPSLVIYGVMRAPRASFYVLGVVVTISIPFLPITIAVIFGAFVTAISSRAKHKSLVSTILSLLLVIGIMLGSSQLAVIEDEITIDAIQNLSGVVLTIIESIYPPAVWLGNAMLTGDVLVCVAFMVAVLLLLIAVIAVVSVNYQAISRRLYGTTAKHNYKMQHLKRQKILVSLYKREWRRYFSSSVYVTNTIVGPVMGMLCCVMILFVDIKQIQAQLPLGLPINLTGIIPFMVAGMFSMMPTTCTSISMEGKEWWIVKSLPIRTKDLLDSKILLYLSLIAPFLVVVDVLLILGLNPTLPEAMWIITVPIVMCVFSAVFGLAVNLKLPKFDWENEVAVVKQSAAAFFGGIGGFILILIACIPVAIVPQSYANLANVLICTVVIGVTVILYKKNNMVF